MVRWDRFNSWNIPLLYFDVDNNNLCPPYPDCLTNQEPFTDLNNNGIWDVGEPFEDINESDYYDEDQIGYQDISECIIIEGDINFDGYVNIYDIIYLVNCIFTNSCDISYDINYDNEININDIVLLIDIILEL